MRWIIVALLWLVPAGAAAQASVEHALEHFYAARFDAAAAELDEVLGSDALELEVAVEAHRYRAALYLLNGDDVAARRHARAAVALDPRVRAPEGVSRAETVFEAARASLPDAPTQLEVRREGDSVVAEARPWVGALLAAIELQCDERRAREEGPRASLVVRQDAEATCDARALSPGGAALLTASLAVLPSPTAAGDGLDDTALWGILGGAAGAVVLTGVIVAIAVAADPPGVTFDAVEAPWP